MTGDLKIRLDKWLWTARFYKTRSAAASAVTAGKIKVNGDRAKPATPVRVGDQLLIRKTPNDFVILVEGLSSRRGPASEAMQLYKETAKSIEKRAEMALFLKTQAASKPPVSEGRPSKRDRQALKKLRGR